MIALLVESKVFDLKRKTKKKKFFSLHFNSNLIHVKRTVIQIGDAVMYTFSSILGFSMREWRERESCRASTFETIMSMRTTMEACVHTHVCRREEETKEKKSPTRRKREAIIFHSVYMRVNRYKYIYKGEANFNAKSSIPHQCTLVTCARERKKKT